MILNCMTYLGEGGIAFSCLSKNTHKIGKGELAACHGLVSPGVPCLKDCKVLHKKVSNTSCVQSTWQVTKVVLVDKTTGAANIRCEHIVDGPQKFRPASIT